MVLFGIVTNFCAASGDHCGEDTSSRMVVRLGFSRETVDGMEQEKKQKIQIQPQSCFGLVWFGGWTFTIGFLHLAFWHAVLALVLWPYYLGAHFSTVAR